MTFSISRRAPGGRPPTPPDETSTDIAPVRIEQQPAPPVIATTGAVRQDLRSLRGRLLQRVITELDTDLHVDGAKVRRAIEDIFNVALEGEEIPLPRTERARLLDAIIADITSFGPIETLLMDDTVDEIMVNGPEAVYVERDGIIHETDVRFDSDDH